MSAERIVRHQLLGDLGRQGRVQTAADIDGRQLPPLPGRVRVELQALERNVGALGVGLRVDGDILAGGHRHGAGDQARDPGDHERAVATPRIRLAVETIPSLAPKTAARSQPMRSVRCRSR